MEQAPQGGGGGQGDPSQPSANRRPRAAGKRLVQAGSPGLSRPQQAQAGSRGRGGQHGKQGASPRMSPPSSSTQPLRSRLHQGGYHDVAKG